MNSPPKQASRNKITSSNDKVFEEECIQSISNHSFYINGNKCELSLDGRGIKWRPVKAKEGSRERQVKFAQIIGAKSDFRRNKVKIYYAKENADKSANQLLKLKKVSIASTSCWASDGKHHDADPKQHYKTVNVDEAASEDLQSTPISALSHIIETALEIERRKRPKRLLIFVNPFGGKGRASHLYKTQVSRLLELADVETTVVMTKYANHARDTVEDPQFNAEHFDGIVCVGGDGMFAELMNGLLFRYNRDRILKAELQSVNYLTDNCLSQTNGDTTITDCDRDQQIEANENSSSTNKGIDHKLKLLRDALGGIGRQFISPPVPIGVIGAGSTDANSFGLIGTNDVITATLNIVLSNQVEIDVCSIHSIQEDRLLRFVSTFVAYGYFGDVIRESEKLRWLGPSRYDITGLNNLIKNRTYKGSVNILSSIQDGSPNDSERCHSNCARCISVSKLKWQNNPLDKNDINQLRLLEKRGPFVGVNAAVTACRCPQTKKGFSPSNHLANGCVDLILVRPCSRLQYVHYLLRTGWTKKSAFDLKYVEAYRCRQFEFIVYEDKERVSSSEPSYAASSASSSASKSNSLDSKQSTNQGIGSNSFSSWNVDGEILNEQSIRVKVNNQLLRVFGTGEPMSLDRIGYHSKRNHDRLVVE